MARTKRADNPAGDPLVGDIDDFGGSIDPSVIDAGSGDAGDAGDAGDSDPGAPFGRFPDGKPRKRRAHGPRANTGAKTKASLDLKALEGILLNIHATVATMAHDPIWAITEGEAEQLARGLAAVSRHYPVPTLAPAVIDHVNLAMAVMAVYGSRLAAVRMRGQSPNAAKDVSPSSSPVPAAQWVPHEVVQ